MMRKQAITWYNQAVDNSDFQRLEFQFIQSFHESELYKNYLALKKESETSPELCDLALQRDEALKKARDTKSSAERENYLHQAAELEHQIKAHPIMKDYLAAEQEIQKMLFRLQDGLNKELNDDPNHTRDV